MANKRDNTRWEYKTLLAVGGCYTLWLATTAGFGTIVGNYGYGAGIIVLFCVTAIVTAFHTSLQHEVVHDHPTPYGWLNEALIFPSLIFVYPFRRYRDLHLKHHIDENLTDPYDDPESYFWPRCERHNIGPLMGKLLSANNTFAGRMILGPPLGLWGFYKTEFQRLRRNESGVRKAWILHLSGCVLVYIWISEVCGIDFRLYLIFVIYPAVAWILVRSFAEHRASMSIGGRTAIVEAHGFFSLLFLNNNLHMVHHAHPQIAWYDLPELYRQRKDIYLAANDNYFYEGYWQIIKQFAFQRKQSIYHPTLRLADLKENASEQLIKETGIK